MFLKRNVNLDEQNQSNDWHDDDTPTLQLKKERLRVSGNPMWREMQSELLSRQLQDKQYNMSIDEARWSGNPKPRVMGASGSSKDTDDWWEREKAKQTKNSAKNDKIARQGAKAGKLREGRRAGFPGGRNAMRRYVQDWRSDSTEVLTKKRDTARTQGRLIWKAMHKELESRKQK